ncbi:Fungal specific transcription factor domain containing protein [Pleurostoma richardsiae]|uniref:Fungal specific transcription factor domain containing protein n=1 Tax=Pleurostoma richardsiae TaxID=41990 RepID=A0AA38RCQ3_9PEZI|nr:Fungal specific transcription factor domain containing protein [Pleurostoma richardsiae]
MAAENRERQRRRKITLACEPCRERKSRCDGRKPICSTCEHRSLGLEQCIYKAGNARTACSDDYTKALHERIRRLEHACIMHGVDLASIDAAEPPSVHLPPSEANAHTSPHGRSPSVLAVLDRRPDSQKTPSACSTDQVDASENASGVTAMGTVLSEEDLSGSTHAAGDFYGQSSAASFLKEACGWQEPDSFSKQPSQVPPDPSRGAALSRFANLDKFALPPRALADHFLQRYWQRVYYLYPFFDRAAFEHAYRSLWQADNETLVDSSQFRGYGLGGSEADASTIVFHSALNAVFALGCCFSDLSASEKMAASEVFFNRSKSFIGLDFLDMNNLGVVQALLVVALVLQGTPFPTRCWNAVGVACRVAQALGLHTEVGRRTSDAREREIRRRTWHGCVIMDSIVSMTFGRPTMTSSLSILPGTVDLSAPSTGETEAEQLKLCFYRESIQLSVILEGILQRIYQPWLSRETNVNGPVTAGLNIQHSLDTIVELESQLSGFERSVTPFLSWISPEAHKKVSAEDGVIFEIQKNVLHARFIYMQLILHRPILTQLSVSNMHGIKQADSSQRLLSSDGLRYSFALECGKSCVEAAKRLIRLIHDTYLTEKTGAWWWNGLYACTAGLVLIVARLCQPLWEALDQAEIDTLWGQCQSILQHQASFSVSARKSLDLLLKVNGQVLMKQAARENGTGQQQSQLSIEEQDETLVDVQMHFHSHVDMLAHLDTMGPSLEDTYMMGPMFTWDQTFDFMPTSPTI